MIRHVYMDEGGRSRKEDEPFTVEAAVIADIDRQMSPVVDRMAELAEEFLPPNNQQAPFHAKDIWHGTKDFHRDRLSRPRRHDLLRALAEIPGNANLPVTWGGWHKGPLRHPETASEADRKFMETVTPVMLAFYVCTCGIEHWMRSNASSENALVIHEDTNEFKALRRNMLPMFQSKAICEGSEVPPHLFPLKHVKDELLFASKKGSRFLQVADVCAFLIKRKLADKADTEPFFEILKPQIYPVWGPPDPLEVKRPEG